MAPGVLVHSFDQELFLFMGHGFISLSRSWLTQCSTGPTLRHIQLLLCTLNRLLATRRTYHFPFRASSRICLSSDKSATSFLSRLFSDSRSLCCFIWFAFIPPYICRQRW